jgi:hypothetical protein
MKYDASVQILMVCCFSSLFLTSKLSLVQIFKEQKQSASSKGELEITGKNTNSHNICFIFCYHFIESLSWVFHGSLCAYIYLFFCFCVAGVWTKGFMSKDHAFYSFFLNLGFKMHLYFKINILFYKFCFDDSICDTYKVQMHYNIYSVLSY